MKRIVIIVVAVLALGVGGWSAFWFVNKSGVEAKVVEALDTLQRAGAPNRYDAIEVTGFPFAYKASVTRLVMENAHSAVTLPRVSAEAALDTGETVTFRMPEKFEILDKASGALFEVASTNLTASVTPAGQDSYDLALGADALTISSETEGAPGPFEIQGFNSSGALVAQPEQNKVRLALTASADQSKQSFAVPDGAGGMVKGVATAAAPKIEVDGSLESLVANFASDRLLIEAEGGGVFEIKEIAYAVSAKPKERFDPSPMSGADDFQSALLAFGAMAMEGVVNGGSFQTRLKLASMQGSGALEGAANAAEIADLSLGLDFGADRVGLDLSSDKILLDLKVSGGVEYFYSATDIRSSLQATPAEAFDFSAVPASGDAAFEALALAMWDQIQKGGSLEAVSNSGPSTTRSSDPSGVSPFGRIESRTGPATSRLALNPMEAVLALSLEEVGYKVAEGLTGAVAVEKVAIDFYAPLKASPAKQVARLRLGVGEVALDDAAWSLIDPQNALTREIKGLSASADASLDIRRDLLSPNADIENLADPAVIPSQVTLRDSYLDLFGLRVELSGEVYVTPLPSGALDIGLTGWRAFFESIQKTPLAEDPQAVSSLLIIDDVVANYGAPLDPAAPDQDAKRFKVEIGGPTGLLINGKPYSGAPPPQSGG